MSHLWRDGLRVELGLHQLHLQRQAPGWRGGRQLAEARVACDGEAMDDEGPAWAPALVALREVLHEPRWAGTEATVVVSNRFVRYLTTPWDEQLVTAEEQLAMVRHAFVRAHGATPEGWTFSWNAPPPPAPCLASAIDNALLSGLREAFAGTSLHLASIQPQLMAAFNACRNELPAQRDCWFLVEADGRICLAWMHADTPSAVYSQRGGDDWTADLAGVLERGMLLAGSSSAPGAVYMDLQRPRDITAELPDGWSLHLLRPAGDEGRKE